MSYGADGPDVFRQTALFVTKIVQGGNPANMPVEQPTRFRTSCQPHNRQSARDNDPRIILSARR